MEDNRNISTKTKITHSSIGAVFTGDVEMQCPAFGPPSSPEPSLEDLERDRYCWAEVHRQAQLMTAVKPALMLLTVFALFWLYGRMGFSTGDPDAVAMMLIIAVAPFVVWRMAPDELRRRHWVARQQVSASVEKLHEVELQIAYLQARARCSDRHS